MRLAHFASVGIASLAFMNAAFAADPPPYGCAVAGTATDCDADGIPDVSDACPFVDTEGPDDCIIGTPSGTIAPSALVGSKVLLDYTGGISINIGADADIGQYAVLGGGANAITIAPKTLIAAAPNAWQGTRFTGGIIGRRGELGYDIATTPDTTKEGGVTIGDDFAASRAVTIGYGATIGDNCTINYGVTIGPRAQLGNNCTIANLAEIGFGAELGDFVTVGRGTKVGNFAVLNDDIDVGPDVTIASYAQIGITRDGTDLGTDIKIRRGATIGQWTKIEGNTVIGRDATVGDYATVENGTVLRASVVLEPGTTADGAYYGRTSRIACFSDGQQYLVGEQPGGTTEVTCGTVPKPPSGSFFSAAGGVVCSNPGADGVCNRIPNPDPPVPGAYCLDEDGSPGCDSVGLQAIMITAPDTIGVSPYSYNISSGSCPNGTTPSSYPATCTVTVQNSNYQLQAGPIYVLSPPTP